jgi:hypothetical protein
MSLAGAVEIVGEALAQGAGASQLSTGGIRMLGVTTAQRSALLPDVPTLKESGIDVDTWNSLIAPAGTPERRGGEDRARGRGGVRRPREARDAVHGADPRHAGRVSRPHRRQPRAVDTGDPRGEDPGELRTGPFRPDFGTDISTFICTFYDHGLRDGCCRPATGASA